MPDTHIPTEHGWLALAKSTMKDALAEARLSGSAFSLVMVGLMGEPPGAGPDEGNHGWLARARASARVFSRGHHAMPGQSQGNWSRLSSGAADRWRDQQKPPGRYLNAVVLVVVAAGVSWLLHPYLAIGSLILPFLITIMLTAIAYGLLPSLLASVLSVLTFDFFFLPPLYSLNISEPDDVMRLAVFALSALIVSNLAAYARSQAVTASQRAAVAEDLYRFGRQLAGAATLREVIETSLPRLRAMLRASVMIVVRDGDRVAVYPTDQPQRTTPQTTPPTMPPTTRPLGAEISAAEYSLPGTDLNAAGTEFAFIKSWYESTLRNEAVSISGTDPAISSRWLFVPMRTGRAEVGMMAIDREALDNPLVADSEALFGTLADLMAQAIDRIALVEDLNRASRAAEREELHAALLASLSHDLRSPLASVIAAADSLVASQDVPEVEARQELAHSIQGEARRLDRYIANLLDMTRIETGLEGGTASLIDLADSVSVALDRGARQLHRHRVHIELAPDLPLLAGDEVLLEHVLFNLLDNAAKYTSPGSLVALRAFEREHGVVIEVADEGEGIRPADLDRIFEKFFRGERPGRKSPGIGLGLSICRGYIEAMGGTITASNRSGAKGAVFTITLPIPPTAELPDLDA
jgi:two-component system sensor histidine kinase KdpD